MGIAHSYLCENCGYRAEFVTSDFDSGMRLETTTPVACPEHGIQQASIPDFTRANQRDSYPCPECKQVRPRWDRETCPKCGQRRVVLDPPDNITLWD